jgi:hypothetical protein
VQKVSFLARLLVTAFKAQAQVVRDLKWVGGKYSILNLPMAKARGF